MADEHEVMDVKQAAEYLKVSEQTLYAMARRGDVPARQVGRQWRFNKSTLAAWLAGNGTPPETIE